MKSPPFFHNFRLVERHFQNKVLSLYTDGGGEFEGLKSYLNSQGIEHLKSPPYTPQRVAFAERKNRRIIETARTLLHQASLPSAFWSFACHYAAYLINRHPTPTSGNRSPYLSLFDQDPNYNSLRVFGCLCYPWLKPYATSKLNPHSTPCVYLGFSTQYHSYQCYDPHTAKLHLSIDVTFIETIFPFDTMFKNLSSTFRNMDWVTLIPTEFTNSVSHVPDSSSPIPPI